MLEELMLKKKKKKSFSPSAFYSFTLCDAPFSVNKRSSFYAPLI